MKRGRDEFSPSETWNQRKYADVKSCNSQSTAEASPLSHEEHELFAQRDEQKEPASSHSLTQGGFLQNTGVGDCTESEEGNESLSLLGHQNPQVRLRALACLYAHVDLFSGDAASTERLFQALHDQLHREDNVHVAQQIVRLLAQLVVSVCKFGAGQKTDLECNSTSARSESSSIPFGGANSSSTICSIEKTGGLDANHIPQCDDEEVLSIPLCFIHSTSKKVSSIGPIAVLPTPETAVQCVKMLLSYASVETESPTLKLQILRSLYQIAKETSGVQCDLLYELLPELLVSSNPFIRAQTLQLVAVSIVTDSDSKCLLEKEDSIGLFVRYIHDSSVVVRKASLHSIILLCCNGYLLTEGCHKAAIVLLEDANEVIRSLALQVVSLWVKQDPGEHTNISFLEVCKMMTDMELSVRIEACKAFLAMGKVREDLLLQALSKQPLELLNEVKEPQSSSQITIPESDVDISKCEEGLNIFDRLSMGAFVCGIEDEFFEVRALMLNVLAHFCCVSTRACAAIIEVMINLLNDDSKQVRLRAVQKLIHVAHCYGLQVNDGDLHVVHGILEDVDKTIRNAGKTLLVLLQYSSVDGFKNTINSLMKLMQKNPQEKDIWHALYKLGKAHSTFVQLLTKDLLIEFKACLSGEAGLDAPECGCILFLLVGASETNPKILSLVPFQVLSLAQLLTQSKNASNTVLETSSTTSQVKVSKGYLHGNMVLGISSEHKEETKDYLARAVRTSWNVKKMLASGMFNRSKQVLRGCWRDIKSLVSKLGDEDEIALTTYALHCIECIYLVWQGCIHFRHEEILASASVPSLSDLACRLEFVVKCMQHTYIGHTDEQKLDLIELSMVPPLWRMISIESRNDYRRFLSDVENIKSTMKQSLSCTPFMEKIQRNFLETVTSSVDGLANLCELGSSFWPRLLNLNDLKEMKVVLSIPQNDLEHPTEFLPDMPFSITVSLLTRNLDTGKIWVRIRLKCLWTTFIFLDASEFRKANPLVTNLQIPGLSVYSNCTLEAAVYLECPGCPHEAVKGPRGYLLPLTPDTLIHLMPTPGGLS